MGAITLQKVEEKIPRSNQWELLSNRKWKEKSPRCKRNYYLIESGRDKP